MQPFGLDNLWAQGDLMTRGIAVLLLLMSLMSWIVILTKTMDIVRLRKVMRAVEEKFWYADNLEQGMQALGAPPGNPFAALALAGREAAAHHRANRPQLHDAMDISDWITRCLRSSIEDSVNRLQAGLTVLASVGATAPFVGLLGTVWGIYHALIGIGSAGTATLDAVAGPVGEALIMTAFGLMVAIPAVLGYNGLSRGNRRIISKMNRFAHDLHAYLITGARVQPANKSLPKEQ